MKPVYEQTKLIITEFDTDDVITTSGPAPTEPVTKLAEKENVYEKFITFSKAPGSWF